MGIPPAMMNTKFIFTSLLALALSGPGGAAWIEPQQTEVRGTEGKSVDLLCNYNVSSVGYVDLYWFRQYPNQALEYILYRGWGYSGKGDARFAAEKFYSKSTAKEINLHIRNLVPADSALYHCALREWGGPHLTFGEGTYLEVEPQSQPVAKPSVFVMRNGTNVACLVKDFYPKNINISLQSSKKIIEYDPAVVVSPSGKYNAVKLGQYGDSNAVKCSVEHNNEIVSSTETEQTTKSPGNLKPMESEIIQQTSESCHEPKVLAREVNMTSLTVLGLRLLFIKTVAVNFLLTAKLFFC